MLKDNEVMKCPNGCKNQTFLTTAHVTQEWEVDGKGNFIAVSDECLEATQSPDPDNLWGCTKCGANVKIVVEDISLAFVIPLSETKAYFSEKKLKHIYDKYDKGHLVNDALDAINMAGKFAEEWSVSDLEDIVRDLVDLIAMETNRNDVSFYVVDAEAETELRYLRLWDPGVSQDAERGDVLLFIPSGRMPETTLEVCQAIEGIYSCILRDDINIADSVWIVHHEDEDMEDRL